MVRKMTNELEGFKLTDQTGCLFNDRIIISISPSLAEELALDYRAKALEAESYNEQGLAREISDFFNSIYHSWEDARKNKV